MSRSSQSGLRSIKRDWSDKPPSSQDIHWDPTPPKDDARSRRLKEIEEALRSAPASSSSSKPLSTQPTNNKRPSTTSIDEVPSKKLRQLPVSWGQDDLLSSSTTWSRDKPSKALTSAKKESSRPTGRDKPPKRAAMSLSQEQTQILRLVEKGTSVFYTGSAGTGKSVLLREIIRALRKKYSKSLDAVAITASTGIAACNIGGTTIHSFSGIGLGIEEAKVLSAKIRKNRKATSRWQRTKVLIIDEVSMLDGDLFDKLSEIASTIRNSPIPFGGIQIIITGDFFQLPPVVKGNGQTKFAFEAKMWHKTIERTFNLTKVFRQRDQEFVDMLNEMRFGTLSSKSIAKFRSLSRPIPIQDDLVPTELFPRREDVERANQSRMNLLNEKQEVFKAIDGGMIVDEEQRSKILSNVMAPPILMLRVGAQVMLIKNQEDGMLVNGSIGKVLRFVDPAVYGTDQDIEGAFAPEIVGSSAATEDLVKKKDKKSSTVGNIKLFPVVEFLLPNGGRREMLVLPEIWKVELPSGEVQASRTQLPLILSWAMSIHKSQGQTLERVKVDLSKVFEKGQAYVALSRATCLEGLQVLGFDPRKVQAHPKVVAWSKTLETIAE